MKPSISRRRFVSTVATSAAALAAPRVLTAQKSAAKLPVIGVDANGAFAEYVAVPERICYKLPDQLPFENAALIEAVSVAVHAAGLPKVRLGDTAVVVGSGMVVSPSGCPGGTCTYTLLSRLTCSDGSIITR